MATDETFETSGKVVLPLTKELRCVRALQVSEGSQSNAMRRELPVVLFITFSVCLSYLILSCLALVSLSF